MTWRRTALLLVSGVLLAACGGGDDAAETTATSTTSTTAAAPTVYSIPSCAMAPTLQIDGKVLVASSEAPTRGDVVVYRTRGEERVSRVVAIGGDRVEAVNGRLTVNGSAAAEPYLAPGMQTILPRAVDVPQGSFFLLGDNRVNSQDSRFLGPIVAADIVGKATTVTPGEGC